MNEYQDNTGTPAELRAMESMLDQLAASERAAAPAGLEARVHAATWRARPAILHEPKVIARIEPASVRMFSPLRVAAGLALAAATGAIWLAGVRTPTPNTIGSPLTVAERYEILDSKVETALAWRSPLGEGFEGLGEQIDLLYADLAEFSIDEPDDDLWNEGSTL